MKPFEHLLLENKCWVLEQTEKDPEYFKQLSLHQNPRYLWIGCSDSRVPPNEITQAEPGELYIHRNMANMVINGGPNLMADLKYAVDQLKVEHIIICGHYLCSGISAAFKNTQDEFITPWVQSIRELYLANKEELDTLPSDDERMDRLADLNVETQVNCLLSHPILKEAKERGQNIQIHGWVFNIRTGLLKVLKEDTL